MYNIYIYYFLLYIYIYITLEIAQNCKSTNLGFWGILEYWQSADFDFWNPGNIGNRSILGTWEPAICPANGKELDRNFPTYKGHLADLQSCRFARQICKADLQSRFARQICKDRFAKQICKADLQGRFEKQICKDRFERTD